MVDMKTQYAGLTLRNPLIVGSSGLTNKAEKNKEFEKAGAGAIVLKIAFRGADRDAEPFFGDGCLLSRSLGLH